MGTDTGIGKEEPELAMYDLTPTDRFMDQYLEANRHIPELRGIAMNIANYRERIGADETEIRRLQRRVNELENMVGPGLTADEWAIIKEIREAIPVPTVVDLCIENTA